MKKLLAAVALLPLLASCAQAPSAPPASDQRPDATVSALDATPAASPIATPSPTPSPTPTVDETLGVRRWVDPETPPPLPTLTSAQRAKFGECLDKRIEVWSKGDCATLVQTELKELGYYEDEITTRIGVSAANAIHRYQRSRDLKPTAVVDERMWYALASGQPARSTELPAECKLAGVVLCVDQGAQRLHYVEDGTILRTVKVRTGGWNSDPKDSKKWRMYPTANGLFRVYNKHIDPPSENYGEGVMPYSVIFDPNMYVHYSADFRKRGYNRSSHGCVNVADRDEAKWIFKTTPIDARVYVW